MRYEIRPLDEAAMTECRRRWDSIAKPLNSLGKLEEAVVRLAGAREEAELVAPRKCVLVFCADNGVVAEGVTQTDASVTAAVARSIAEGTANVNAMAKVAGADVFAVDMGMLTALEHPALLSRRLAAGTGNIAQGPAMTRAQAESALQSGIDLAGEMRARGYDILATGEMGIGNTTTASALAAVLLGRDPGTVTGRGAGLSDAGLKRKLAAIRRSVAVNDPNPRDPLDVLAKLGGFDIAGMAGAFIGGATHRLPVVIDGFISAVAALVAARLAPACRPFLLASHESREPAGRMVLEALGLSPLIRADMALGEGTGAVALLPLIDMALAVYHSEHTFQNIAVAAYQPLGGEEA